MDEVYGCGHSRDLLAELATGVLTGHERAEALQQVAGCASCRAELAQLARAADALLLLSPEIEPPHGFEGRVIAALGQKPRPKTGRRLLALAASVVLAAALGAAAVWRATAPDRSLADQTRQTLAIANGKYLKALKLTTDAGTVAGTVFLYQGSPSWLLVNVTSAPNDGGYRLQLVGREGRSYAVGTCEVSGGTGTTAYQLKAPVDTITEVHMNGPGDTHLVARA
jgi:hypothetical protein